MKQQKKLSDQARRVEHLLNLLFDGNQSRMASEIGIAQPVINRVLNAKHQPGKRLMEALASHPKVNPNWLATGNGEPILAARSRADESGWPVPIATSLLPGQTTEHPGFLSNQVAYVPGATFRETLYAIAARKCLSNAEARSHCILPDDLLLIETDASVWTSNVAVLRDRLCAVARSTAEGEEIRLTLVAFDGTLPSAEAESEAKPHQRSRGLTLDKDATKRSNEQMETAVANVCGVIVQLIRNY